MGEPGGDAGISGMLGGSVKECTRFRVAVYGDGGSELSRSGEVGEHSGSEGPRSGDGDRRGPATGADSEPEGCKLGDSFALWLAFDSLFE